MLQIKVCIIHSETSDPKYKSRKLEVSDTTINFFKILSKYITYVAYEAMKKTMTEAYSHSPFIFQMGVNPRVIECQDTNLKLMVILENNTQKYKQLFYLFTEFKRAFV